MKYPLVAGATVRTPDGASGRIITPSSNGIFVPRPFRDYDLRGKADVAVYAVLMDTGEVRWFEYTALVEANSAS